MSTRKNVLKLLSRKTHTNAEKRNQLRRAFMLERHGPNANLNALIAANNEAMRRAAENVDPVRNHRSNSNHGSKANHGSNSNHGSRANHGSKRGANKPKKWARVNTSHVTRRL